MGKRKNRQNDQKTVAQKEIETVEVNESQEQPIDETQEVVSEQTEVQDQMETQDGNVEEAEVVEPVTLKSELKEILDSEEFKHIRSFVSTLVSYYQDAEKIHEFKPILITKHRQLFLSIKKALTEEVKVRNQKVLLVLNNLGRIGKLNYFKFNKELGRWRWSDEELEACNLLFTFLLHINDEGVSVDGLKSLGYFTDEEIESLTEIQKIVKNINS